MLLVLEWTLFPSTGQYQTHPRLVVPGTNVSDLRRFVDMNLQRPLEWLGIPHFEVASMERGSPAIRLIHKLSEIPEDVGGLESTEDGPASQDK